MQFLSYQQQGTITFQFTFHESSQFNSPSSIGLVGTEIYNSTLLALMLSKYPIQPAGASLSPILPFYYWNTQLWLCVLYKSVEAAKGRTAHNNGWIGVNWMASNHVLDATDSTNSATFITMSPSSPVKVPPTSCGMTSWNAYGTKSYEPYTVQIEIVLLNVWLPSIAFYKTLITSTNTDTFSSI